MIKRLLTGLATGAVTLTALVAYACASTANAPTDTPVPTTSTTAGTGNASPPPVDAYIVYRDDLGTLAVRDFQTGKTYHQAVDGTVEVIVQTRCVQDGSRVAYLKQVFADANNRLIVIRGNGAPGEPLEVSSTAQWVAWSPNGSELAVARWNGQDKVGSIDIVNVASGQSATVLEGDQFIGNIGWSSDGDWLTFYLQSSDFSKSDIYKMRPDGSDLTALTPLDGELLWLDPAWSPDGTWIVATGARDQAIQLYRIEADGSGFTQLSLSNDIYKRNPFFSPDGSILAFTGSVILPGVSVNWDALHQFAIFTMNPDGTDERALTADPRGTTPGPNDPYLNAYILGWCAAGPWLDELWEEQAQ